MCVSSFVDLPCCPSSFTKCVTNTRTLVRVELDFSSERVCCLVNADTQSLISLMNRKLLSPKLSVDACNCVLVHRAFIMTRDLYCGDIELIFMLAVLACQLVRRIVT